ncbi:AMP-binding protein [Myceligenerans pegani]|uniref:Acyl--CoA ligase n=1 Tax=Myceligenerans pegani TaxID=2776917 RepID=A0ABR9MV85_9MICO|nr:class I adenylate-forming enzyme family protein [Myceligenerans sp. TRM 65318]MBE1875300.1 acyl--CoA ligase [Myceligenerans sp. TRM 65318]MBE3017571.1 acyl--CoA ligase [Myceligenerans sp. TRM 65318]
MSTGKTFVDELLTSVADGGIDRDEVALRWFGDAFPGARGARRGCRVREEVTFAALADRVEGTATGLRAAGMRVGERVLFSIRPRPEGVVLCLAVIHAGGSIVFVDPGSTPELFEARLAAARPRWAATEALLYVASSGPLARLARARGLLLPDYARLPVRHLYSGTWLPGVPRGARRVARLALGRQPAADGAVAGDGSPDGRPADERVEEKNAPGEREALVVFTSGTTSDPRAVVHTTSSLGGMLALFAQVGDPRPGQRAHTDQMFLGLPALLAGGTWEIPARTPAADPAAFARGVAGADTSFAVPADVTALLDVIEKGHRGARTVRRAGRAARSDGWARRACDDQAGIAAESGGAGRAPTGPRVMAVGAAPVTPALMERAVRVLPETHWICVYGATEMLPVAVVDGADKAAAVRSSRESSAVSPSAAVSSAVVSPVPAPPAGDLVGTPLDGVTARIDAPDDDGVGELVISGPSLMAGYLADLDAGRPAAVEHRTGDLARVDDLGRLMLVGRTRDMIIRGTVNIYPGLFEPRVRALPGVGDALMVGVPMDDGDERVVLVLVADRDHVRSGDARGRDVPSSPADATRTDATRTDATRIDATRTDMTRTAVTLTENTALARAVGPRLLGVLDHGALPDLVVEAPFVPLAGRSRKPDRSALAAAAASLVRESART